MLRLIVVILIISCFDLIKMAKNKQKNDIVCFAVIAISSLVYGYYYNTHMYTASFAGFLIELLQIK